MEKGSHSFFVNKFLASFFSIFLFFLFYFFIGFVHSSCLEGQIDINSASIQDLKKLDGIGDVKAQAIINERPFNSIDDLLRVKGIGNVTLQKIKKQGLACVASSNQNQQNFQNNQNQEQLQTNQNQEISQTDTIFISQKDEQSQLQSKTALQQKINLNTATLSQLTKINGIGEKIAQEIISSRPFCSLEDLLKVKGIGPQTLEKIKDQGVAYVEENFCKIEDDEEKIFLSKEEGSERNNILDEIPQETINSKRESIINLNSNKEETNKTNLMTGKVIYESKTEKIRRYAIYFFSILLIIILVLTLKD